MSWWRKANSGDAGAINGWIKIQSIWRKSNVGDAGSENGWIKIKSIWRHTGGGLWEKIFGPGLPYIDGANPPELYFVDANGFETIDSPFNGMSLYLTRGMWEEEPLEFTMAIEKSASPYTTWENFESTPFKKVYEEYKDEDYLYKFPATVSARPSISKTNVRNKIKFRGKIIAENSEGSNTFTTDPLAARLWFSINTFEITDETPTTITFSWSYNNILPVDIPTDIWSHQIQLYNSLDEPILPVPEVAYLYDTSITINKPADLDTEETYQWELEAIADDYYRELTGFPYTPDGPTAEYSYIEWTPGTVLEDPEITFSGRTVSGFNVNWLSSNAERYEVDIYDSITANSLYGYPKITEELGATVFGLSEAQLITVSVKALSGSQNQNESNEVLKSIRTLNIGIQAVLSDPYDQSSNGYKVLIENYSEIDDFDIQVDVTNGDASRSGNIITISNVSRDLPSCVTVTTSKIDDVNLTVNSYDVAVSPQTCETIGTWYCVQYVNTTPISCSTFESDYDVSGTNSFTSTTCYTTPSCCAYTSYGEWTPLTECLNGKRSKSRVNTIYNLNCTSSTVTETVEEDCWYCTTSVPINCAGCTQTIESTNISGSGTGYSTACSQITYPACQTSCICDQYEEADCGDWVLSEGCTGNPPKRTYIRDCPQGSPCSEIKQVDCWYCTTSVPENCAGCTQTLESSNISASGTGYQTTCSQTGYPSCQTPCTCTALKEADCGDWVMSQDCTGNPPKRTYIRDCPAGSPCAEVKQTDCWYCTESYPENCAGCNQTVESSNISGSGSGYSRSCSQSGYPSCGTPCACDALKEADCGDWVRTQNCVGNPPQSTYIRDCPPGSPCSETRVQDCWYCTESYPTNCAGCNQTVESSNISGSGSGYSRSCSQSGYPSCGTPCACDAALEAQCGTWSCGSCTGNPPTRTCTRTCPAGSPCSTSKTESCWYCTESYTENCAGCNQSIQTSNISSSGSGYSISCSQSGYPSCGTPCTCTSTKEAECGTWSCGSCTGNPPTRTCTRTCPAGSPCSTSKTESCWYCTTSVNSNCAGCTQTIESSNISSSGSGYQTSCSQSAYPTCQTPCVQWWCKTTQINSAYCSLSGPFTSDQSYTGFGSVTVCTTGNSNPYSCVAAPFFPFFPPFFPFFPPYFAPSPYFPFFPPFFPFFPPFFPFFPPYFAAPPFFPFFPPYFPFFPPFFKAGSKCLNENTQVLTTDGYKAAKDISVGDKLYTIAPHHMSDGKVENAQIPAKVNFVEVEVVKAEASDKSELIKFNDLEDLVTGTQPVFVKTASSESGEIIATYKMASEVKVGDVLIRVEPEECNVSEVEIKSVEIISGTFQVYDIRTSPWPWFIIKDILIIS